MPTGSTSKRRSATSPDQIAIAPGYLQKEWTENGRRYFHYKMDAPMLNLYSIQSARYAVRRDRWQDVNLEIYYQPGHEFDLDTMMESMKESLAYCSANFSPFQFHQLRIIEFPALRHLRRVICQHDSLLRGDRFHHQGQRQARRREPSLLRDGA